MAEEGQKPRQFHENTLVPVTVTYESLTRTLRDLCKAVDKGVKIVKLQCQPATDADEKDLGTIFNGDLGLAFLFLRLERQKRIVCLDSSADDTELLSDTSESFLDLAAQFCRPPTSEYTPTAEHGFSAITKEPNSSVSPLTSSTSGPAFVRLLAAIQGATIYPCRSEPSHCCEADSCLAARDLSRLEADLKEALEGPGIVEKNGHKLGRDEILVGRAGMVWALSYLASTMSSMSESALLQNTNINRRLISAVGKVELLVRSITSQGELHDAKELGSNVSLLWPWLNDFYALGAVHGATGILATLLSANLVFPATDGRNVGFLDDGDLRQIIDAITGLCQESIRENGHLAMSVPAFPSRSNRTSALVQICHGAPGLLQLLAITTRNPATRKIWRDQQEAGEHSIWNQALALGSDAVWREGLLAKGGGLCHGIAGNSWPWLTVSTADFDHRERLAPDSPKMKVNRIDVIGADEYLGKALAFLLEARNTRPFIDYDEAGQPSSAGATTPGVVYSLPDKPFGLYTGLAGTVAAWAEACVVLVHHIRRMEIEQNPGSLGDKDPVIAYTEKAMLGFPGLS